MGCRLEDIIKKFYKSDPISRGELKNTVAEQYTKKFIDSGMAEKEALEIVEELTNMIDKRFDVRFKKESEQYLKRVLASGEGKKDVSLTNILKLIESGAYSDTAIANILKDKYKIPYLSDAEAKTIMSESRLLEKMDTDSYEYRGTISKIQSIIESKTPKTLSDRLRAIQGINLFGNTKTLSKILFGNVSQVALHNAKEVARVGIDKAISLFTKQRTATLPNLGTQTKGFKNRFGEVVKDWKKDLNTDPFSNQFEYKQGRVFDNKVMHNIHRTQKTSMTLFESPFKQAIYDDILRQEMKLAGINKPTQEMKDLALKEAEKVMFHDENVTTELFQKLRGGINKIQNKAVEKLSAGKFTSPDPAKFGVGNLLLPVLKTPINMAMRAAEYSPLNAVRGIGELAIKGKAGQKVAADALAKATIGTGIGYGGYKAAKAGLSYGSPDKDKDVNDFRKEIGKQPYSANVPGGINTTYDFLQPGSTAFAFGTELGQTNKNKKPLSSALNTLLQQSVLQNVNQALGGGRATGNPVSNIGDALMNSTSQVVPSALRQISKAIDKYQRDTSSVPKGLSGIVQGTPLRGLLPSKLSKTGEPIKEANWGNIWFNPSNTTTIKDDKTLNELSDLYERSGLKTQFPSEAPSSATFNKKKTIFTPDQQRQLQIELGKKTLEKDSKTINTTKYKNASDEVKAKLLAKNIEDIKALLVNRLVRSTKTKIN